MFRNYLLTALRNTWKNKTYSFLNLFGLAIGITCAGLIFLWVESEVSYDKTYERREHIYRVLTNQTYNGSTRTFDDSPGPLAPAIKAEVPGVADVCRTSASDKPLFGFGDKRLYETGVYADPSFFNLFSLAFVEGNARDALHEVHNIILTEHMANQFFGQTSGVIGRTITMNNAEAYTVSGVIRDFPGNSTLQMDWVASFEAFRKDNDWLQYWGANGINTYIELAPAANPAAVAARLKDFINRHDKGAGAQPVMLAMNDWHLRDQFTDGKPSGGRIEYVRLFTFIAWIVLFIACINFMNLATARSEKRAREVGVRKVLGAERSWLITQFIGESVFLSALSVLAGIVLIALLLPAFNVLVERQLSLGLDNPLHLLALAVITLICGLVAGSYPALYLSSFNPIYVLKGFRMKGGAAAFTRKSLVVLQFTVSIVLIISTVIVYRQVQHIKNRNLGYEKNDLLDMPVTGNMIKDYPGIRQDLLQTGLVENTALVSAENINTQNNGSGYSWEGKDPKFDPLISFRAINSDYIQTMGMHIIEGRDLKSEAALDSMNVLVTEALAKMMGKGSVLGRRISDGNRNFQVVGVVGDYVYGDMYGKPDPVIFHPYLSLSRYLYVRLKKGTDPEKALAALGSVMKKDNPSFPFSYTFVDEQFNARFTAETLIGKLSGIFAALAIFISCLGLFGLASYTAEQRTREIGIRKVLGASVSGLTGLLSKDFLKLVLLSNLLAIPLAWWAMLRWLEGYAYRITISWRVFAAAAVLSVVIAVLTVSFQSIRAALMNPVRSLRTE
jgi:predicted permease